MSDSTGAHLTGVFLLSLAAGCAARAPADRAPGEPGPLGLQEGLGTLPLLGAARTRSISAENPTGEPGGGGRAIPAPGEAKPAASARAADDLGQGWKVRPFLRVNAGQTVKLMDVAGPGVIQHIWIGSSPRSVAPLYRKEPAPSGPLDLGVHQLSQGDHTLRVEIAGASERAKKDYMFGLDYVLLVPIR